MSKKLNHMLKQIKAMHFKFGITDKHIEFTDDEKKFRIKAMQEELDEYREATSKEDEFDALIDLVVFALGTAERQGMLEVFEKGFNRVMIANCAKEVGTNKKRGSFAIDLVKPDGWTTPVLTDLLESPGQQELDLGDK